MASKAAPQQVKEGCLEEEKRKNVRRWEGRSRKALGDIGNVVNVATNITRPVTRRFCAQLLANSQVEEEKKKVEVGPDSQVEEEKKKVEVGPADVEWCGKEKVVHGEDGIAEDEGLTHEEGSVVLNREVPCEKVSIAVDEGLTHEEGSVVLNREVPCEKVSIAVVGKEKERCGEIGEKEKVKFEEDAIAEKGKGEAPARIPRKSFTAILASRSKIASVLSIRSSESIEDIDSEDVDDELAEVAYVGEIYKFYREVEVECKLGDYMDTQAEINDHMRAILVDWLIDVHRKFELMSETLYLAINLVDRYLSLSVTRRRDLQLVGMGAMLLACKYEEIWAPAVEDFVRMSDMAYSATQVLFMEKRILRKLEWYLTVPTPWVFLVRYIKASLPDDGGAMQNVACFLAELGLLNYTIMTGHLPSVLAASAVYAARQTLGVRPFWTETLKHYSGYDEEELVTVAGLLVQSHSRIIENRLRAVLKKFSKPEKGAVALLPPAKIM